MKIWHLPIYFIRKIIFAIVTQFGLILLKKFQIISFLGIRKNAGDWKVIWIFEKFVGNRSKMILSHFWLKVYKLIAFFQLDPASSQEQFFLSKRLYTCTL